SHQPVEAALDAREPADAELGRVDARHVDAERVAERDQDDRVDEDLGDSLAAHLEALPPKQRVDEVAEDGDRDGEPEDVGRRHQTRSSTYSRRRTKAKHAAAIASAARSNMTSTLCRSR